MKKINSEHKIIVFGGLPGSGKSTAAKSLSKSLDYPYLYIGGIFRKMAADRGVTLLEMQEIANNDPSIDLELENQMLKFAKSSESAILDGHISAPYLRKNGVKSLNIWLEASPEVRAERIGDRENGENLAEVKEKMLKREAEHRKRWMDQYGIDMTDKSVYDLIVPTDNLDQEGVLSFILDKIKSE